MKGVLTYRLRWKNFPKFEVKRRRLALLVWPFAWARGGVQLRWRAVKDVVDDRSFEAYAYYMDKVSTMPFRKGLRLILGGDVPRAYE